MEQADLERMERESVERRHTWEFRGTFYFDIELPQASWAVDDEIQTAELTEDNLRAATRAKAPAKPVVTVSAPLHLVIGRIIGFTPPYRHIMEAR